MSATWIRIHILIAITVITFTSACGDYPVAEEKKTIKIGYLPITHAAPLYFANESGHHHVSGVEMELIKFSSWIELMDALNTGRIDGASVLIELAMKAKEKGIDLKAVSLGHRDGNAVIASNELNDVEDLIGTTVAIPHTLSSQNILLNDMLKRENMTLDDVNVVEMPPPEMPSALAADTISSYIVAEPFGALGVTLGEGKVLYQSEDIWPNSLCCVLVLRGDLMQTHPDSAQQLVTEYVEAGKVAEEKGVKERAVHKEYLPVDEEALALSLEWISYQNLRIDREDYDKLTERLVEMGLSESPPHYEDFVDNSLFDEATEAGD